MRILLDSNIIQRNAVVSDPQHPEVNAALVRLIEQGWELCIGFQNIAEFYVVATRPVDVNGLGLTPERAIQEIEVMLATYTLLPDHLNTQAYWLDLCRHHRVQGRTAHDTRLVALMLAHSVTHLLTLNTADFARYTEITCLSPADVP